MSTVATELERYMLDLINADRATFDLDPLTLELDLNLSAERHSAWMLDTNTFSHTGEDGSSPTERMREADFTLSGAWRTAENIAVQSERGEEGFFDDVADLHTSLMNSPGHRANLLNPDLEYIGIGIEIGDFTYSQGTWESVIVTQNFATTQANVLIDAGELVDRDGPASIPGEYRVGTDQGERFVGTQYDDRIEAAGGDDEIRGGDGADVLLGGSGDDQIFGGASDLDLRDEIFAGAGADTVDGGYGNDLIYGQEGHDVLLGGFGADTIHGQTGDDMLSGGAFSDELTGGAGDDYINGGFGFDRVNGGDGADSFYHLGISDHGTDWIQDFTAAQDDVLIFGGEANEDDFQINYARTSGAGASAVAEAFIIYKPTDQILWALIDGGAEEEINLRIASTGETFDLLG